jgi:hypothetical protein
MINEKKKKTKSVTTPTPTGLRPQHPERGGTGGGNGQQHATQAAAHETQAAAHEQKEGDARAQKRTPANPQHALRAQHNALYAACCSQGALSLLLQAMGCSALHWPALTANRVELLKTASS